MAVDTAVKRCSALTAWVPFSFGNVPSGTVSRPDSLWTYRGLTYTVTVPDPDPGTPFDPADNTSLVQPWKNVTPNRRDPTSLERAIKTLDRRAQDAVTQIMQNVTNIQDGTTAIPFTWAAYVGP